MKLSKLLPSIRWIPHDLPVAEPSDPTQQQKEFQSPHRRRRSSTFFSRKPRSSLLSSSAATTASAQPNHGPSPPRRKSTLSLRSMDAAEAAARTHAQAQSMFFAKLPPELRKMVYEDVMGPAVVVHLTLGAKRRFGHFVCDGAPAERKRGVAGGGGEDWACGCKVLVGGGRRIACGQRLSSACVRVLRVCRRMYTEAIPHLYTPHTFSLLHPTHLLYLPSSLPAPRLHTIRTLHLRWPLRALPYFRRHPFKPVAYPEDTANWEKGWGILASMEGLQELRVVIVDPSREGIWEGHWLELEDVLLEPVKGLVRPRRCVVVLPYATCGVDWDMGGSRVVLRRPLGGE